MSLGINPKNDLRRGSPEVKSGLFFLSGTENATFYVFRRWFNADDDCLGPVIADADAWWNAASIALPLHGCN